MTTLKTIRDITCFNQAESFQYWCMLSWKHKELREALDKGETEGIHTKLQNFEEFALREIGRIFHKNLTYLVSYFKATRGNENCPRFSIKVPVGVGCDQELLELVKLTGKPSDKLYKTAENSGFLHVTENGTVYLCNDLPAAARRREYNNPRLVPDKLDKFRDGDLEWESCWVDDGGGVDSFYKSTLIVPMTLKNNALAQEFKESFMGKVDKTRTIFGFLCFDRNTTDYFNSEEDVDVGYIMADWLSLYLMAFINYTSNSYTYKKIIGEKK